MLLCLVIVSHFFFFSCLGKTELLDYGLSWVTAFIVVLSSAWGLMRLLILFIDLIGLKILYIDMTGLKNLYVT